MKKKKRKKIKFCYEDHCKHITFDEQQEYNEKFAVLIEIIYSAADDDEIMARAREYDGKNGADIFSEAVNLKTYCIACHRVDCTC